MAAAITTSSCSSKRRFSRGFYSAVLYTRGFAESQDFYYNEFDARPSYRPNNLNRPHRFVWTPIYELPFGKDRKWVQNGPLRYYLVGGWQLSWIYQRQSGPPTDWANLFFYGDVSKLEEVFKHDQVHNQDVHLWFDPSISYRGTGPVPSGFCRL